jgi:hypothetical protein
VWVFSYLRSGDVDANLAELVLLLEVDVVTEAIDRLCLDLAHFCGSLSCLAGFRLRALEAGWEEKVVVKVSRKVRRKEQTGVFWIKTRHFGKAKKENAKRDTRQCVSLEEPGRCTSLFESTPWAAGSDRSSPSPIRQARNRQSTNPPLNGTQWELSRIFLFKLDFR